MKNIGLPTVLIKISERKFCKAMVHYIILEPLNGPLNGEIPALLLSHPWLPEKWRTTCFGELLPLEIQNCKTAGAPIARSILQNYNGSQDIFTTGCMFRLRLIKLGRLMEGPSLTKQPELIERLV